MKYLLFILIILNSFLNIQCQISASNQNIILEDYDSNNKYSGYPPSPYTHCTFSSKYIIKNAVNTSAFGSVELTGRLVEFTSYFPVGQEKTEQFQITNQDNSLSTSFTLLYACYEIDENSLQISLLESKFRQSTSIISFLLYVQIKGLAYPLENISVKSSSPYIDTYQYKVTSEIFQVLAIVQKFKNDMTDFQFSIVFPKREFNFTTGPFYSPSLYQSIEYQTYPNQLANYKQIGSEFPVATFTSIISNNNGADSSSYDSLYYRITSNSYYSYPIRTGQTEIGGIMMYNYIFELNNRLLDSNFIYNLEYNNGSSLNTINIPVDGFKKSIASSLAIGKVEATTIDKIFYFTFNSTSNRYRFNNVMYKYVYYQFSGYSEAPFGFVSGNNLNFTYKACYRGREDTSVVSKSFSIYEYPLGKVETFYRNPYSSIISMENPQISLIELLPIQGFIFLVRIQTRSLGSVLLSYGDYIITTIGSDKIVESVANGDVGGDTAMNIILFEAQVNIMDFVSSLKVQNFYSFYQAYSYGHPVYISSNGIPVFLKYPIDFYDMDIENVTFAENDIDILNKPNYNTIYFNSTTFPIDYPLALLLQDDVSNSINRKSFPASYDTDRKLFYCDFVVPKNSNPGFIMYSIHSVYLSIGNVFTKAPLRVSKTKFDNEGPIISSIINANTFGKVGWRITITDQVNGFSSGYIKVVGSLDSSIFKFNFTISDAVLDSGSTVWRSQYDIIVNVNSSRCSVSQDYSIDYIYLEDSNQLSSYFTRSDELYPSIKNPLRNHLDNLEYYLKSSSKCLSTIKDSTPPELVSFNIDHPQDVGSIDRVISFKFIARDLESGLLPSQRPIVYIQSGFKNSLLQCESTITSINDTHAQYVCQLQLPIGYGSLYENGFLISVYGFINNAALYSGFSSDHPLLSGSISSGAYSYYFNYLLTGYEPYYLNSTLDLILYVSRQATSATLNVSIVYFDGTTKWYTPTKRIGSTALVIKRDDYQVIGPFNVTVDFGSGYISNTLSITPVYYNKTDNSLKPEIPVPTNKPQQCIGDPVCGGPSNGYCNQASGCVCYAPWVGKDCLSKVIIIPQPNINDTNPTTEIPIDDNYSGSETEESQVFYKSLVSIVSLRELSINNSVVHKHSLDKWILHQIDPLTSQYSTTINYKSTSNSNRQFEMYATLKWFINETTIQFADQQLKMNPSSMKYTIDIFNYPFESALNRLQLVIEASFSSNKSNDICSSKEFGDTTSGDNSNYIKIQVNNKSLYGRFIKRGIIDDNTILLSNELLDSEMNAISSPSQVQSYIGISIPWFERHSVIDPDFSVLVDSSSASSICASNKSGLSTTQIAGIIIGCVVFFIAIVATAAYSINKSKKQKRFIKGISNKLKVFKQDQQ